MTFKNKALNVRIGIIRNEKANSADDWIRACENKGLDYYIVDLSENNWLDKILGSNVDFYVTQPPGTYERFKTLFDERLYIITNDLKLRIFPFYAESLIYENKKMLSYYLKSHNIPHPKTCVFYNDQEAITYVEQADLPIVAKTNIGASGAGVKIIRSKQKALSYINLAFHGRRLLQCHFGGDEAWITHIGHQRGWDTGNNR